MPFPETMSFSPDNGARPVSGTPEQEPESFEVSPLMLFPETTGWFSVYLKVNGKLVLYAKGPDGFTKEHQHRLHDFGVSKVHILTEQKHSYQRYVENNLGSILSNEKFPMDERAEVFHSVSLSLIQESFETKLPGSLSSDQFQRIRNLVEQSLTFLRQGGSFKAVAGLINHDYYTYNHCVNVFTLAVSLLETYGHDQEELVGFGLGAILHDLGKLAIPKGIINKPGRLSQDERRIIETHPVKGAAMCAGIPLSCEALNIVLFHHERLDGSGYPAGMVEPDIPIPLRIVALCDVYDALTTDRPYAKQRTPVEALTMIREEMSPGLDMDVFKRLVHILSGAKVV